LDARRIRREIEFVYGFFVDAAPVASTDFAGYFWWYYRWLYFREGNYRVVGPLLHHVGGGVVA
jgi:hypothetical protein